MSDGEDAAAARATDRAETIDAAALLAAAREDPARARRDLDRLLVVKKLRAGEAAKTVRAARALMADAQATEKATRDRLAAFDAAAAADDASAVAKAGENGAPAATLKALRIRQSERAAARVEILAEIGQAARAMTAATAAFEAAREAWRAAERRVEGLATAAAALRKRLDAETARSDERRAEEEVATRRRAEARAGG